jgi:hypothetical protein
LCILLLLFYYLRTAICIACWSVGHVVYDIWYLCLFLLGLPAYTVSNFQQFFIIRSYSLNYLWVVW